MNQRQLDSAQSLSSAILVERLKSAANDVRLVRDLIESHDSASVAAAVAALVASRDLGTVNDTELRKKLHNRPCPSTPNETLVEILLFMDRDALDAMQLVCRFLLEFIENREAKVLPLRSISQVNIGKELVRENSWGAYWLPTAEVVRDSNTGKVVSADTVNQLVPYLRLAFCESVRFDLRWSLSMCEEIRGAFYGALFGDLVVPNTSVNVLTICFDDGSAFLALRAFDIFKPAAKMVVDVGYGWTRIGEAFFTSAAGRGIRTIEFKTERPSAILVGLVPAISFGFAQPTDGGDRGILSVAVTLDDDDDDWGNLNDESGRANFLAQLIKKADELHGRKHIDFKFTIDKLSESIDSACFEKYQKDERIWLIDDMENEVTVEVVVEADLSVEIHVFSSS